MSRPHQAATPACYQATHTGSGCRSPGPSGSAGLQWGMRNTSRPVSRPWSCCIMQVWGEQKHDSNHRQQGSHKLGQVWQYERSRSVEPEDISWMSRPWSCCVMQVCVGQQGAPYKGNREIPVCALQQGASIRRWKGRDESRQGVWEEHQTRCPGRGPAVS